MRRTWTDSRLDDLNAKVDRLEIKVDRLDTDMRAGFERLYRLMVQIGAGVVAALIGLIAVLLGGSHA